MRRLFVGFLFFIGLILITLNHSFPAVAAPVCVHMPNHGVGRTTPGGTWYGGRAYFPEKQHYADDWSNGRFALTALWNQFPDNSWVELGWTHGFQGQDIFAFYFAYQNPSGYYFESKFSKSPSGFGTLHKYYIYRNTSQTKRWYLNVDDTNTLILDWEKAYSSSWLQTGGEFNDGHSYYSSIASTNFTSLMYYKNPNRGLATSWPNNETKTICFEDLTLDDLYWDWISYPTSGKAYTP